jgi:hypothetical protein
MTDRLTNEELEALITSDVVGALTVEEIADIALLARVLTREATWAEPGAGLEDTVVRAVMHAEPVADAPLRSMASVVTPLRPESVRRRRVPQWAIGVASAAAIAIAVLAGLGVHRTEAHPVFEAELTATALARGAGASAEMYHSDAGFRVTLDAHGLPALPAGEYYQAWLRDATGTVVPIGTFSTSQGDITLWSGVSARNFPMVSVTVEPTDNEPAPSAQRVLTGVMRAT